MVSKKIGNICAIIFSGCFALSLSAPANNGGEMLSTVRLGTVDGKTYYVDSTERTWVQARQFCNETGMQLATITSAAQASFLGNAYNSVTFNGFFWIGGRDAQTLSQFSWDNSGSDIDDSILPVNSWWDIHRCLMYTSSRTLEGWYGVNSCTTNRAVLCETV